MATVSTNVILRHCKDIAKVGPLVANVQVAMQRAEEDR